MTPGLAEFSVVAVASLSGFVLARNSEATVEHAVQCLIKTCDEVLVVDTGSTDSTIALCRSLGARTTSIPWRGFGAARRFAVDSLRSDYCFFLDSDEMLTQASVSRLGDLKKSLVAPAYRLTVNDRVLGDRNFLFRVHRRCRVFRRSLAKYDEGMLVHESPAIVGKHPVLPLAIDHHYHSTRDARTRKVATYSLLWALRHHLDGRLKSPGITYLAHLLRGLLIQGSIFRGGLRALPVAHDAAMYHRWKYLNLRRVRAGVFPELVDCFEQGRFEELFRRVSAMGEASMPRQVEEPRHGG